MSDEHKTHLLLEACKSGDCQQVECILAEEHNPNAGDYYGWTGLHVVAQSGNTQIAKLLVSKGADPNLSDEDGWMPLHFAAEKGFGQIVELLLARRADVNASTNAGRTALQLAAVSGSAEVAGALLRPLSMVLTPEIARILSRKSSLLNSLWKAVVRKG